MGRIIVNVLGQLSLETRNKQLGVMIWIWIHYSCAFVSLDLPKA